MASAWADKGPKGLKGLKGLKGHRGHRPAPWTYVAVPAGWAAAAAVPSRSPGSAERRLGISGAPRTCLTAPAGWLRVN